MDIKELRKINNLTQDEFAQKLFVTRQAVSRWENGETIPSIDTLKLISNIFGISINTLVDIPMEQDNGNSEINADRFLGYAKLYENSRPVIPETAIEIMLNYLDKQPEIIVDLGCGTGLSTYAWLGKCKNIIGIEPSEDMIKIAKSKSGNIRFIKAYAHETGLPDNMADIVVCSQSFHWMNPQDTLHEVNRILCDNGIFVTIDCDWPPVCNLKLEMAYNKLLNKVHAIERDNSDISGTFNRWSKDKHLQNIWDCSYFSYAREIVFHSMEKCDADRFIGIALSQGGLQTILKIQPNLIKDDIIEFQDTVRNSYGDNKYGILFCYRMRIGIKN